MKTTFFCRKLLTASLTLETFEIASLEPEKKHVHS